MAPGQGQEPATTEIPLHNRTPLLVLVGVVVAFVVALAVFGSGSETVAQSTTSTFADIDIPDPPLTTTTRPRAVEVTADVLVVEDLDEPVLLGLERLVVVVGQSPGGHRLLVIDHPTGDVLEIPLHPVAADFALDASGTILSYLGGDLAPDTRWLVPIDGSSEPQSLDDASGAFAWSGDEPLTAAWLEPSAGDLRVVLGEYTRDGMTVLARTGWAATGRLAGFNSSGVWTYTEQQSLPRATVVEFTARDAGEGWATVADIAITPASGTRALLARLDVSSWSWNFGLGADDLRPLSWAPGDASGDYGFAALSPTGIQVAFIGSNDGGLGWLEIHSTVGGTARRLALPYRVWDVRWSQRGDYVVMPGTDGAGTHAVVLSDTRVTSTQLPWVYAIEMDDWVQFATVVDSPRQTASNSGPAGN